MVYDSPMKDPLEVQKVVVEAMISLLGGGNEAGWSEKCLERLEWAKFWLEQRKEGIEKTYD